MTTTGLDCRNGEPRLLAEAHAVPPETDRHARLVGLEPNDQVALAVLTLGRIVSCSTEVFDFFKRGGKGHLTRMQNMRARKAGRG